MFSNVSRHTAKTKVVRGVAAILLVLFVEPVLDRLAQGVGHLNTVGGVVAEHAEELTGSLAVRGRSVLQDLVFRNDAGIVVGVLLEAGVPDESRLTDVSASLVDELKSLVLVTGNGTGVDQAKGSKAQDTGSDDLVGEHLEGLSGANVWG